MALGDPASAALGSPLYLVPQSQSQIPNLFLPFPMVFPPSRGCFRALTWLLSPVLLWGSGHAQVILYVDGTASGSSLGTSWENAYPNLQSALINASSGDQIWVASGVYRPDVGGGQAPGDRVATFQLKTGVKVYGGFPPGGGDGTFSARDQDPPSKSTILSGDLLGNDGPGFSGNTENSYHVVTGSGAGSSALLDGFRITGANANGSSGLNHHRGGGFTCFNSGATVVDCPTVNNCVFVANSADQGGAAYIRKSSIVFTNCQFTNNTASSGGAVHGTTGSAVLLDTCGFFGNSGSSGGAVFNYQSSLNLIGCQFLSNSSSGMGGALNNSSSSSATVTDCTFEASTALVFGGAVYNSSSSPAFLRCSFLNGRAESGGAVNNALGSVPSFTDCTFQGNSSTTDGGGVSCTTGNGADFHHCIFSKNSSAGSGGGVYGYSSSLSFENCSLTLNSANWGGAIATSAGIQLVMTNTDLRGNQATQYYGGALYASNSSVDLTNCAFVSNLAVKGGALGAYKSSGNVTNCSSQGNRATSEGGAMFSNTSQAMTFSNCIIWNNSSMGSTASQSASLSVVDFAPTFSHCLFENYSESNLNDTGANNLDGTNPANFPAFINPLDPSLAPANGGDLRLNVSSPVLNLGDNSANLKTTDLAGAARVQNGIIDLGAYEGGYGISFAVLFPGLDPDEDANANGTSNFGDYAEGKDPFVSDGINSSTINGSQLNLHHRWNATDLIIDYEMSSDLETWIPMVEGSDYVISFTTNSGSRTSVILNILQAPVPSPGMFYRERFTRKYSDN